MKIHTHLLLFLFLLILFTSNKQDSLIKEKTDIKQTDSIGLSEAKAYKMLYENQVKSNDSILKTIIYALSGLGGAVLLVFASNWWFNEKRVRDIINEIESKIKEVKKNTLTELTEKIADLSIEKTTEISKMQIKLQEEVTKSITYSTLKFTDFTEKIRAEIKEDNKTLSENYQKQLDAFNENYRQQISTLNETLSSQYLNLRENINEKDEFLKKLISSEKVERIEEINRVLKKLHRVEYYMWEDRGVHVNAFRALLDELSYKLRLETTDIRDIHLNLRQMSDTLDKCSSIYPFEKENALKLIKELPDDTKSIELKNEVLIKLEKINLTKTNS